VSGRVVVRGPAPRLHLAAPPAPETPARKGARRVFFIEVGRYVESTVYHRYALRAGVRLRGPAVIEEPESTVVLGPGVSARLDAHGNILAALPRALAKAAA
jgi:N-methylhydantoinase A